MPSLTLFGNFVINAIAVSGIKESFSNVITNLPPCFSLISTTPNGEMYLEHFRASERCALIIGNEARGISDEVLRISDMRVKIAMDGLAESLNAAVAAGIAMHWIKNCSNE